MPSFQYYEDPISQTIDAAVRLQPRCSEKTEGESGEPQYTTRLLVPTSRIGCLIGKGGTIISEMRMSTRANIRILSKENLPKVASEDDEMVQVKLITLATMMYDHSLNQHVIANKMCILSFMFFRSVETLMLLEMLLYK